MRTATRRVLAVLCVGTGLAAAVGEWKIPDPRTTEHPGAREAPASDPRTYPDEAAFAQRSRVVLEGLAAADLSTWRKGYFAGGDPGKYMPGPAMAKLMLGADLENVAKFMNDDRSPTEHYHFACVNLARFYPIFGSAWTDAARQKFADTGFTYGSYLSPAGTENHKTMWMTSANVLPHFTGKGLSRQSKEATLAKAKDMLRRYVQGLYRVGQGEWDSSTYLMFDFGGMLNIYDFSPDPECRLLAKAALDWYAAAYALKYMDGVYTAPNQRGFASVPAGTIADQTGWIWWGGNASITTNDTRGWRHSVHAITSSWRPNKVLCNIARRNLPQVPFEQRNTKPNYWYGTGAEPKAGAYSETVYAAKRFTMGTLWRGHGSQITRFQVAVSTDNGAVVFTGGHPRQSDHTGKMTGVGYRDGNGRYSQFAQVGPTAIHMALSPEDETEAVYSFVSVPDAITPQQVGAWWVLRTGEVAVSVYPLGGKCSVAETAPDKKGNKSKYLRIEGRRNGFVVHAAEVGREADLAPGLAKVRVDDAKFSGDMEVTCGLPDGRSLRMKFVPGEGGVAGERMAEAAVNGEPVTFTAEAVYAGPYVNQKGSVLSVNDGTEGFVVDFTGDLPVYRPWTRPAAGG